MQTLLLVGGGHTHALLLRHARRHLDSNIKLVLVSPERFAPYSGMLPGLIAGHYRFRDCHIDLARLCEDVGARLICARVEHLDLKARRAQLSDGQSIAFDAVSINCGIQSSAPPSGAEDHSLSVKPISRFLPRWQQALERLYQRHKGASLAVVGGGATGVELAMAIRYRLDRDPRIKAPVDIHLVHSGGSLLPDQPLPAQMHASRQLHEIHVRVHPLFTVTRVENGQILTDRGQHLPADEIVWCIEGAASNWPAQSGLACNDRGFIQVNDHLQSASHPFAFAAGDIACITSQPLPRSGVYAVRQAPILATNLARYLRGEKLRKFKGQKQVLSIMTCGEQYAIARRGKWVLVGKWVWRWKSRIDRRFMAQFPKP